MKKCNDISEIKPAVVRKDTSDEEETTLKKEEEIIVRDVEKTSKERSLSSIKQRLSTSTKVKPTKYVGFSKLPNQVYRKSIKKGLNSIC